MIVFVEGYIDKESAVSTSEYITVMLECSICFFFDTIQLWILCENMLHLPPMKLKNQYFGLNCCQC